MGKNDIETVKTEEEIRKETIEHFQKYLPYIRRSLGWSTDDLADAIGTKRQTINNLESNPPRAKLSYDKYRNIRLVLANEIINKPEETVILKTLLDTCVDKYDEVSEEERESIIEKAKVVIPSMENKEVSKTVTNEIWGIVLTGIASFVAGVIVGANYNSFGWLNRSGTKSIEKAITTTAKQINK